MDEVNYLNLALKIMDSKQEKKSRSKEIMNKGYSWVCFSGDIDESF